MRNVDFSSNYTEHLPFNFQPSRSDFKLKKARLKCEMELKQKFTNSKVPSFPDENPFKIERLHLTVIKFEGCSLKRISTVTLVPAADNS